MSEKHFYRCKFDTSRKIYVFYAEEQEHIEIQNLLGKVEVFGTVISKNDSDMYPRPKIVAIQSYVGVSYNIDKPKRIREVLSKTSLVFQGFKGKDRE